MSKKSKYADEEPVKKVNKAKVDEAPVELPLEAKVAVEEEVKAVLKEKAPAKETPAERDERVTASTIRIMMETAIPAMLAGLNQAGGAKEAPALEAAAREIKRRVICRVCLQGGKGAPPCGERHQLMVVYPQRYPKYGPWFPGCIINGIRYLSDHRSHRIYVPEDCVGQITKQLHDYEENEEQTRNGRVAEHNSGEIRQGGGGTTNTAGASNGWR